MTTAKRLRRLGNNADHSKYAMAFSAGMQISQLNKLYPETNQARFINWLETDGAAVLEETS